MSSGQKPRTRDHFPRMKVRGARRRAAAQESASAHDVVGRFAALLESVNAAALVVSHALTTVSEGVALAVERERQAARAYMGSERFQLDLIAVRHRGDPIARSQAVGEYFTQRAHRELDELAREQTRRHIATRLSALGITPADWQIDLLASIGEQRLTHSMPPVFGGIRD